MSFTLFEEKAMLIRILAIAIIVLRALVEVEQARRA